MFNPHYFSLELTDKEVLKQRGINPVMTKAKQEVMIFQQKQYFWCDHNWIVSN